MRCCREEQTMLEASTKVADRACELRLDAVLTAARWCGVVRLIEDQQTPRQHRPEPLPHRIRVGRIDQEIVRYEEAAVRAPRVHSESALPAHPRQICSVEDFKDQSEAILQF